MRKAAYMQVTRECNNECVFCSNPQFDKDYTFDEAKKRIDEFREDGITEIILTGGEPTLVKFLPDLIDYIVQIGLTARMITNGIELTEQLCEKLVKSGLIDVNISIHDTEERVADRLSQKNHLQKSLTGLRNAILAKMNVTINSTINSLNCMNLTRNVKYMIENFPEIRHFVFNNLDPGMADGRMVSRAGLNPWVVAKFIDYEIELKKMVDLLKSNNKTFRIERVPLCYMRGFEEFSTETRKIVKDERYICSFIDENDTNVRKVNATDLRTKTETCRQCLLNNICGGVQPEYLNLHGGDELYPVFDNPRRIVNAIRSKERLEVNLGKVCNNECLFCMSKRTGEVQKFTPFEQVKNDILRYEGFEKIIFLGGEPTIYPEFKELVKLCKGRFKSIGLITNGRRLSDAKFLKELVDAGLDNVSVSVHNHKKEVEDYLTQKEGFDEKVKGLRNLLKLGVKVFVNIVLTKKNLDLADTIEFFSDMGVKDFRVNSMRTESGNAQVNRESLLPAFKECEEPIRQALKIDANISLGDFPPCVFDIPGILNHMGEYIYDVDGTNLTYADERKNSFNWMQMKRNVLKFRPKKCQTCSFTMCEGVWKSYYKKYGDKELCPL